MYLIELLRVMDFDTSIHVYKLKARLKPICLVPAMNALQTYCCDTRDALALQPCYRLITLAMDIVEGNVFVNIS